MLSAMAKSYAEELPKVTAWEERTDVPLTVLAFAFLVAYAYPILVPSVSETTRTVLTYVDIAVWLAFAADYVIRLVIARRKWLFIKHNVLDLCLVVLPPARPLRLLRVTEVLIRTLWFHVRSQTRARLAVFVAGMSSLLIVLASLAVLDAERGQPGADIHDFGDALWWSVVSVTTVGYGDFAPVTAEGRLVAVALMVVGIGLIGFVTGSMTTWVIDRINEMSRDDDGDKSDVSDVLVSVHTLRHELTAIREELARVSAAVAVRSSVDDRPAAARADLE
jgi:voltage-gated potassium channel